MARKPRLDGLDGPVLDHGQDPTPCPYCEGEGCSECDGTGERYATYISAGDGLTAVVRGNAFLDDEAADAIVAVMRSAYDLMAKSRAAAAPPRNDQTNEGDRHAGDR